MSSEFSIPGPRAKSTVATTSVGFLLLFLASSARADDITGLIRHLGSDRAAARLAAADSLGDLGPAAKSATAALVKALGADDENLRFRAARALGSIGPAAKGATGALVARLADKDPVVRAHAAFALGRIGQKNEKVVASLFATIKDKDQRVQRAAITSLRALRPTGKFVIPLLCGAMDDDDPAIAALVVEPLVRRGKASVPGLIKALERKRACYWACLALADIGADASDAVPALLKVLETRKERRLRMQAILALAGIGDAASSAAPKVLAAIDGDEDKINATDYAAVYALGTWRYKQADARIRQARRSKDPFLQMVCDWALARIHPDDKEIMLSAVKSLTAALRSEDSRMRIAAARGLAALKAPKELVAPRLIALVNDKDPKVVANVIGALSQMGPEAAERVGNALKNEKLRHVAVQVLTGMGPKAKAAVPVIIEVLGEKVLPVDFRSDLQFALGAIGPDAAGATDVLIKATGSGDQRVSHSAMYALGRIGAGAAKAAPALRKVMQGEAHSRLPAVWALVRIQPKDRAMAKAAVPLLVKGLGHEDALVRMECVIALGDIAALARSAAAAVRKATRDENEGVREAAKDALLKIGS